MFIIFDSLPRWHPGTTTLPAVDKVAIVAAFPGRAVYYTHDHVGFELVSGEAQLVS